MIWDKQGECLDRKTLREIQLERLKWTLNRVYENVPFYRKSFDEAGIRPEDIKTLDDVGRLPFTTKEVLRDNYPFGLFASPRREVVRIHASSGTTGKPIVVGYTRNDLETWTNLVARIITMAGVTDEDVAQICFGYGFFTGGFGLHYGMEKVGAMVVPASSGNTEKQIMLMQDFGTTALVSTPSYALYMAEVAKSMGIDPKTLPVRVGLFGGESCTENMRREIEELWPLKATDNYGLTEVIGPGVSGECTVEPGLHINEDHFLVEVIDPDTGEPLDYGEEGELVFTTLTKEAFPVVRYRTRDISVLNPEPCRCGRTTVRMRKTKGRTDDMLIIKGVNVFPSQVEAVLLNIEGITPHYQMIVTRKNYLDSLEIQVEIRPEWFSDNYREIVKIEEKIQKGLQKVIGLDAKVTLVAPNSIERTTGKSKRVIDLRPK
ncbi:MAG: phenylacetate--CoA ligase [Peptococcaceae bacterium]|jgi:phenylacetate-CoA ligase|nr:phenylacetate--CoA ligase [Peptococcaceae bacterium]